MYRFIEGDKSFAELTNSFQSNKKISQHKQNGQMSLWTAANHTGTLAGGTCTCDITKNAK